MKTQPKPTRFAAALRYKPDQDCAPIVVASGQGDIAETILKIAAAAGIPNYVEPGLAQVLSKIDPGTPIPRETYSLVAEIITFIWKLDREYQENS